MTTTRVGSATSPAVPSVSRTTPSAATAAVAKALGLPSERPEGGFDEAVQQKAVLNPRSQHLAQTAAPDALWGNRSAAPKDPALREAMKEFRLLSPDAQKAKIEELKTKQDDLSKKMLARIETLDARYKTMRNVTKAEMLRNLGDQTNALSPEQRAKLDGLLDKADGIAKQIDDLKAKAATLPDAKTATPEQKQERTELARQIRNARSRLSDATKAATTYVDSLGLKADRLAVNEQKIDPNAPPKDSPNSLTGMIKTWFELDRLVADFSRVFEPLKAVVKQMQDDVRQNEERRKEDARRADERRELDRIEQRRQDAARLETRRQASEKQGKAVDAERQVDRARSEAASQGDRGVLDRALARAAAVKPSR